MREIVNFRQILKFYILHFVLFILTFIPLFAIAGVKDTKHNLSVSGPGEIIAVEETQICKFCHTPHNSSPAYPLWSHQLSAVVNYINYWSPTLQSYSEGAAPPIDGLSKLCLSCHDGTVALGAVAACREDIDMVIIPGIIDASGKLLPGAAGYIGTDLSGGHPISILFDENLKNKRNAETELCHLNWPLTDNDVKRYPTQGGYGVQCPSCHDPHGSKGVPDAPPFWRKGTHDDVCNVCHKQGCIQEW
ncbi:MAG: hypothetical protein FJ241_03725 [Nitrospira sp.]|nr:hypothetical protein [Nitrospira sp.]